MNEAVFFLVLEKCIFPFVVQARYFSFPYILLISDLKLMCGFFFFFTCAEEIRLPFFGRKSQCLPNLFLNVPGLLIGTEDTWIFSF